MKLTIEVEIDQKTYEDLVQFLANRDMFGHGYIGYWARGVEHDRELGWLVWEQADDGARHGEEPEQAQAIRAWRSGTGLPEGWHRLDEAAARKAVACGVARWGVDGFLEDGDANSYDVAVQLALLGEVRYG